MVHDVIIIKNKNYLISARQNCHSRFSCQRGNWGRPWAHFCPWFLCGCLSIDFQGSFFGIFYDSKIFKFCRPVEKIRHFYTWSFQSYQISQVRENQYFLENSWKKENYKPDLMGRRTRIAKYWTAFHNLD